MDREQQSVAIWTTLDWITNNVLQHKADVKFSAGDPVGKATHNNMAWLRSRPVRLWYTDLVDDHKRAFGTLLLHIASETCKIGARDGCFIALSYIVSAVMLWLLVYVKIHTLHFIVSLDSAADRKLHGQSVSTSFPGQSALIGILYCSM